jgi:hypothetical protein
MWRAGGAYFSAALAHGGWGPCLVCGQPVRMAVVSPAAARYPAPVPAHMIECVCPRCGPIDGWFFVACAGDPAIQAFIAGHARWHLTPETAAAFAGRAAVRMMLADVLSSDRLTVFADRATAQVLFAAS